MLTLSDKQNDTPRTAIKTAAHLFIVIFSILKKKAMEINLDITFHDFSYPKPFPNQSFRDEDHLKLGYWRNYYAFLLRNYIENKVF